MENNTQNTQGAVQAQQNSVPATNAQQNSAPAAAHPANEASATTIDRADIPGPRGRSSNRLPSRTA